MAHKREIKSDKVLAKCEACFADFALLPSQKSVKEWHQRSMNFLSFWPFKQAGLWRDVNVECSREA